MTCVPRSCTGLGHKDLKRFVSGRPSSYAQVQRKTNVEEGRTPHPLEAISKIPISSLSLVLPHDFSETWLTQWMGRPVRKLPETSDKSSSASREKCRGGGPEARYRERASSDWLPSDAEGFQPICRMSGVGVVDRLTTDTRPSTIDRAHNSKNPRSGV